MVAPILAKICEQQRRHAWKQRRGDGKRARTFDTYGSNVARCRRVIIG